MQAEIKLNREGVESYAKRLADKLCSQYFTRRERISGPEMLSFCTIKQVNLLVMKAMYDAWQKETTRLRSPYFDYSNQDVVNALQVFMNTLSQHISLKKDTFSALLESAILNTLVLAYEPENFFAAEIQLLGPLQVKIQDLKNLSKYIVINKVYIDSVVDDMQNRTITQIYLGELKRLFIASAHDNAKALKPTQSLISSFNSLLAISEASLLVVPKFSATTKPESNVSNTAHVEINFGEVKVALSFDDLEDNLLVSKGSELPSFMEPSEVLETSFQISVTENEADNNIASTIAEVATSALANDTKVLPVEEKEKTAEAITAEAELEQDMAALLYTIKSENNLLATLGKDASGTQNLSQVLGAQYQEDLQSRKIETISTKWEDMRRSAPAASYKEEKKGLGAIINDFFGGAKKEDSKGRVVHTPTKLAPTGTRTVDPFTSISTTSIGQAKIETPVIDSMTETAAKLNQDVITSVMEKLSNQVSEEKAPTPISQANAKASMAANSFRNTLTLKEKANYQSVLFDNDETAMYLALDRLDTIEKRYDAVDILLNEYAVSYDWDFASATTKSFLAVIDNKYKDAPSMKV